MIGGAIDFYHSLLTPEVAEQANADLRLKLKERGLYFGERPICVVLRPFFYAQEDWAYLRTRLQLLLKAFARTHQACMENPDLRAQLVLDEYEESLIHLDKGAKAPWSSSRLDTFYVMDSRTLKCVEYNAETPAGIGYGDVLGEVFAELEPMKRFRERYYVEFMPALGNLLDGILRAYKAWGARETSPQMAILDWREVPTLNEHELCRLHFERGGIKCRLADPRALEYHDGQLWIDDFRIDIVYKRVLYSELFHVLGTDNPFINAMRDRNVFTTNSISAKLLAKKASLAFLSDDQNSHLFTPEMREAIHDHIPWTRLVGERKTTYNGQEVDLTAFILANKDKLVLKPNDEYGGKGVVIGWESSDEGWEAALRQAMVTPHVVQERVQIVTRKFPMWLNGELDISPRFIDADPYVFYGEDVFGCLTRLSPVSLLNVTAGGGSVVPTAIVQKK